MAGFYCSGQRQRPKYQLAHQLRFRGYIVRNLLICIFANTNSQGPYQHVLETHVEEWASDAWENSVFTGPPRQEVEDAWDELQRGIYSNP